SQLRGLAREPIASATLADRAFWSLVVGLSEPGQDFRSNGAIRTDNLISNERSFQEVVPLLRERGTRGAYLGVGPGQNFDYVADLSPTIAINVDNGGDNLLLNLMYKALAESSADRAEFMPALFARPRPPEVGRDSPIERLLTAFRGIPYSRSIADAN